LKRRDILLTFSVALSAISMIIMCLSLIGMISQSLITAAFRVFFVSSIGLLIGLVLLVIATEKQEEMTRSACENNGGKYVVVGHEQSFIMAGKVLVPTTIEVHGCKK
jgi:hypothetical protein